MVLLLWKGGRRLASVLDFRPIGQGLSPGQGYCVVFLGKTFFSHSCMDHWPDADLTILLQYCMWQLCVIICIEMQSMHNLDTYSLFFTGWTLWCARSCSRIYHQTLAVWRQKRRYKKVSTCSLLSPYTI